LSTRLEEPASRLKLRFGGQELWFEGAGGDTLRMGRDATCEIVIADRRASRQHARIEKRRSKFVLVDQSANGTSVAMAGEAEIYLRREELVLRMNGSIGVGRHLGDHDAARVEFYCL
jgi:predicted component of type VI protein secretion system